MEFYPKELLEIPANRLVHLTRERHLRDLKEGWERAGLYYNEERAQRKIDFASLCCHSKGEWRGQPFEYSLWQEWDIQRILFGWEKPDNDKFEKLYGRPWDGDPYDPEMWIRRFNTAYIEVAKKNGKSTECSVNVNYFTLADREGGAEVYCLATKKDQARIVWGQAKTMLESSPDLKPFVQLRKDSVFVPETDSISTILSADSKTEDGKNPHAGIGDETHLWPVGELWDMFENSMTSRKNPMLIAISTAGSSQNCQGWILHQYGVNILERIFEDDSFFVYIATIDEEDDPFDEDVWIKANPNLGVSIYKSKLRDAATKAKNSPASYNSFLRYRMNRWTTSRTRWLIMKRWNQCKGERTRAELEEFLEGRECWGGLDLSSTIDISAFVLAFPLDNRKMALLPYFWVPEENMEIRFKRDKVNYPYWHREGFIRATPGDVVDYDKIREEINDIAERFEIKEIAYDPKFAQQLASQLQGDGFEMVKHSQKFYQMSSPCLGFETLVHSRDLIHAGDPVLKFMAGNVVAIKNPDGELRLDKEKSGEKIDGIVASVMATGRAGVHVVQSHAYDDRGFITT